MNLFPGSLYLPFLGPEVHSSLARMEVEGELNEGSTQANESEQNNNKRIAVPFEMGVFHFQIDMRSEAFIK
jgi:hypothetical protein